jgi:AcrR family transcriptional regulator
VGECNGGRRELRKAQRRAEVRAAAQRLFDERGFDRVTIADVAAAADVAVQTVFNHFETKEALFFDGRTPWVHRAVAAVAERPPGSDPVAALHAYLAAEITELVALESRPEDLPRLQALRCSTALRSYERMLVEQTADRVAATLSTAISAGDWPAAPAADPATAHVLSGLIASLFLVAGRVLVLENRRRLLGPGRDEPGPDGPGPGSAQRTTTATLTELERCVAGLARQLLDRPG